MRFAARPRVLGTALVLILASSAAGQDRAPNPNAMPGPPPAPDLRVGPIASASTPRALTEDDVEAIVERVIARQASRQTPRGSAPPPEGWQPPAAPSSQYQGPVSMPYASAQSYGRAPTQTVAVLVPAGPIGSALGRLGGKVATLGQPRVRTYRVATTTAAIVSAPVYATGQAP